MINEFMPDFNIGVVGAWSNEAVYNPVWDCYIPDVIRPSMIVLDCTGIDSLWESNPADLPVIAVHKIPSFKETFTKGNKINGKYFRGYKFVSFGTFYSADSYLMLVYVKRGD